MLGVAALTLLVLSVTVHAAFLSGLFAVLFAILVVLPFRRITVHVDSREVTVRYAGPVSPTHRIDRRDISSTEVVDLRPLTWGGWGYRGSRLLFGRAAVLIRGGPGLKIETRDGKSLSISVDGPEGAVAALDA